MTEIQKEKQKKPLSGYGATVPAAREDKRIFGSNSTIVLAVLVAGLVLFLHILGIWGLIYGMGKGDSPPPPARPPIQTR
ncbi:hypothetical protein ACH0C8_05940, partial [Acetobacter lovaniensis]|uniref:hypothetical protein n=1 Tax=Acetobacter lovaniensis TaxID=104100 RepID=UPI00377027FE